MVLFSLGFHTFLLYNPIVHHSRNQWPGAKLITALFSLVIKDVIASQHPKYFGWFSMGPAIFSAHIWLLPYDEAALGATPPFSPCIADAAHAKLPCAGPASLYEDLRSREKSNWCFARAMAAFCFAAMSFLSPALCTQDTSDPFQVPLQCLLAELSNSSCNSQAPLNLAPVKTILNCIPVLTNILLHLLWKHRTDGRKHSKCGPWVLFSYLSFLRDWCQKAHRVLIRQETVEFRLGFVCLFKYYCLISYLWLLGKIFQMVVIP